MEPLDITKLPSYARNNNLGTLSVQGEDGEYDNILVPTEHIEIAEVITSLSKRGKKRHRPILDIDFAADLIPSSTPGHYHLYLDRPMSWEHYKKLLLVLGEVGILEPGYVAASLEREYTAARLPWIRK